MWRGEGEESELEYLLGVRCRRERRCLGNNWENFGEEKIFGSRDDKRVCLAGIKSYRKSWDLKSYVRDGTWGESL